MGGSRLAGRAEPSVQLQAGEAVMLPLSVERCPGKPADTTPFECWNCARRQQGIADYMAGEKGVVWMEPGEEAPCPERLERKHG
jgi:hypothetical protein